MAGSSTMLFADDAAVVAHTHEELQSLMDYFSQACKDFGLTISLKKTNVLGQDTEAPPPGGQYHRRLWTRCCLPIHLPRLHHHWQPLFGRSDQQEDWEGCFNSHPSHSPSLDKPQAVCVKTKMAVYNACVISTLLYGSETWTTYSVCRAGEKAQHIPPEKHPPYPGNMLAELSNQRWSLVSCWSSQYVHSA